MGSAVDLVLHAVGNGSSRGRREGGRRSKGPVASRRANALSLQPSLPPSAQHSIAKVIRRSESGVEPPSSFEFSNLEVRTSHVAVSIAALRISLPLQTQHHPPSLLRMAPKVTDNFGLLNTLHPILATHHHTSPHLTTPPHSQITTVLGLGAYGSVKICRDKRNGEHYAIKTMLKAHLIAKRQASPS